MLSIKIQLIILTVLGSACLSSINADVTIVKAGRFAIRVHNKEKQDKLKFEYVKEGFAHYVFEKGTGYNVTIVAKDKKDQKSNTYRANVWKEFKVGRMKLLSFKKVKKLSS
ncbi:OLC1v1031887C1 [Oldenlandia corymbosa var. corymbosa]|uniref:OLC1v1031887C1 n=1 Tax=Oldenlandia corymbosa var. corymbosa TaxID=529605 RepID=A0AAV1CJX9_OLDCO|nr:OLC1v1031887C1 [Oldenlandia corymbosa var. corymbosa]